MSGPTRIPSETHQLTVRAATAPRDAALQAWRDLVGSVDLADLWDHEVYALLPLVWWRLGDAVGAEHADRLHGMYRKAWVTDRHLRRQAAEAVTALRAVGVDPLVVQGLALGTVAYDNPATRPVPTVDLLVHPPAAVAAWRHLERRGYRSRPVSVPSTDRWWRAPDDGWYLRLRRPRTFDRGPLDAIVVHTTLAPELVVGDPQVADVSGLWSRAVALDLGDVAALTPSPADHLLHVLLLLAGEDGGGLGRVVDARHLADRAGSPDWAALVDGAQHHRCSLVVADVLDRLRRDWEVPVPSDLRARLLDPPPDGRQRLAARLRSGRLPGAQAAARFVTTSRGLGPVATVAAVPSFLTDRWQVDRGRHLPAVAARRLVSGWRRPPP